VSWTHAAPGGGNTGIVSQGWIGAPGQRARVMGLVPITVAAGVTVGSASVSYWPANTPTNIQTLATAAAGGPGATLPTLPDHTPKIRRVSVSKEIDTALKKIRDRSRIYGHACIAGADAR
jgi:hypothetical protein